MQYNAIHTYILAYIHTSIHTYIHAITNVFFLLLGQGVIRSQLPCFPRAGSRNEGAWDGTYIHTYIHVPDRALPPYIHGVEASYLSS